MNIYELWINDRGLFVDDFFRGGEGDTLYNLYENLIYYLKNINIDRPQNISHVYPVEKLSHIGSIACWFAWLANDLFLFIKFLASAGISSLMKP